MTPIAAADIRTIGQTRAFYEALARGCDSDVEQIEVALAHLAELQVDEATLDGFQSAQEDARRAAGRCRSTVAVLDARQALLEEAVNTTPAGARIEFYQDPAGAKGSAVTSTSADQAPPGDAGDLDDEVYHERWCADPNHPDDADCPTPHMSWCTERDHDTATEECKTTRSVVDGFQIELTGIYADSIHMTMVAEPEELTLDQVDAALAALQQMRDTMARSRETEVHNAV